MISLAIPSHNGSRQSLDEPRKTEKVGGVQREVSNHGIVKLYRIDYWVWYVACTCKRIACNLGVSKVHHR